MFYADLHVHSKFSRATSRDCDLEHLAFWAARKGIALVATGDFTHPGWFQEIQDKLIPAEPGLFRLGKGDWRLLPERPEGCLAQKGPVPFSPRFMLQVEISTIYKKDGRTRKVHHLIYVPDLDCARHLSQSLSRIGNLGSDGRPILGLDSRNLLEIVLQSGEGCFLIPAHIWTPWFAVLGSKSGFDSIEHCYGDLSSEIFALETGLSSDPEMNWRLSALDRYALVSNSDAHSPPKLGREACLFQTELDYFAILRALKTGQGYGGTVEFFPEEGKYHYDGHRKCGVCLKPEETRRLGGKCPVCAQPVTLGVMYRVCELADRGKKGDKRLLPERPEGCFPQKAPVPFSSLIPLDEVLSEIHNVGPHSNLVRQKYEELLKKLGPELFILEKAPLEDLARHGSALLAEAMSRMRQGRVIRQAGFDGQYGTIRLFTKEELLRQSMVGLLFDLPQEMPRENDAASVPIEAPCESSSAADFSPLAASSFTGSIADSGAKSSLDVGVLAQLDPDQRVAAEAIHGPVLIIAGPGTGKTRTLTHRIAHLIADHGVAPEKCLAITFSRRAAAEMIERLQKLLPEVAHRVPIMTFHALGLLLLKEYGSRLGLSETLRVAGQGERAEMLGQLLSITPHAAKQHLERISRRKRSEHCGEFPEKEDDGRSFDLYQQELRKRNWLDFDDLIRLPLELLKNNADLLDLCRWRYGWVSVDEFQDVDHAQSELLKLLVAPEGNICAIGDPDQAIYGFRGADVRYFQKFSEDFPAARIITLTRNYRSTQTIVDAALQLIAPASLVADRSLKAEGLGPAQIEIHACTTDRAEAEFVVHTIERMLGGSTFFSFDSRRVGADEGESYSFADFAVLYRTESQADLLVEALARSGMPFQRRSHSPLADQPYVQALLREMANLRTAPDSGEPTNCPAWTSVLELLDRAAKQVQENDPLATSSLAVLRSLAANHENNLAQFLSELALGADVDLWDPRADRISLLTLHAAKGLEFPVVFIVGCEDGLIPLHWGAADQENLAEERRVFFVGMTRARRQLILTHAKRRRFKGAVRQLPPSPFLDDIQRQLLAAHQHQAVKKPVSLDRQRMLFEE
jgi:DNA helicase-2/ATP-dependent DNA helicase PcrA